MPRAGYHLPAEPDDTDDGEEARLWLAVYRALLHIQERRLDRFDGNKEATEDQLGVADGIARRRDFWQERLIGLAMIEIDDDAGALRLDDISVPLSRREGELIRYLAAHQERAVSAEELITNAWRNTALSQEQVRGYVRRLRRRLRSADAPFDIATEKGSGYRLRWR